MKITSAAATVTLPEQADAWRRRLVVLSETNYGLTAITPNGRTAYTANPLSNALPRPVTWRLWIMSSSLIVSC
jgi:hypothetical protein